VTVVERPPIVRDALSARTTTCCDGRAGDHRPDPRPRLIQPRIADVRTDHEGRRLGVMGIGLAGWQSRNADAAKAAISSPLRKSRSTERRGDRLNSPAAGPRPVRGQRRRGDHPNADDPNANIIFGG